MYRIEGTYLQTRLAQRALIRFLAGALVPSAAALLFGYCQVADRWIDETEDRLAEAGKSLSVGILHRLETAGQELETVKVRWRETGSLPPADDLARFVSLTGFQVVPSPESIDGASITSDPGSSETPVPSRRLLDHLGEGRLGLLAKSVGDSRTEGSVWLGTALDPESSQPRLLWARIRSDFLWADRRPAPTGSPVGHCVLDSRMRPIRCDHYMDDELEQLLLSHSGQSAFSVMKWEVDGNSYITNHRELFLGFEYAAPPWHILTTQPASTVLSQAGWLILLIAVGAFVLAFLLTSVEARKSLEPIRKLTEGTERIAAGDLATHVAVEGKDEFGDLARSFNSMARSLETQFETLETIRKIDREVLGAVSIEQVGSSFIAGVVDGLGFRSAGVVLLARSQPERTRALIFADGATIRSTEGLGLASDEIAELKNNPEGMVLPLPNSRSYLSFPEFGRPSECAAVFPMVLDGRPVGVAVLPHVPGSEILQALGHAKRLVEQMTVALANAQLLDQLERLNWGTIRALGRSIDAKSEWTAGHTERVARYALALARRLRLPESEWETLHRGALLHDIGKIGIPSHVLDKTDPLTEEEWELIRAHPQIGADILAPIDALRDVIPIVLHHHEKWNGTGYPGALRGEDIPLLARILGVVDVFDALTSDRPYRPALSIGEAVRLIEEEIGIHFEPKVGQEFIALVREEHAEDLDGAEARFAVA